jgi:dTDP-4-dehydrorhamnose reductase
VTILVFGKSGQVARSLNEIATEGNTSFEFVGRDACDLGDAKAVAATIEARKPTAIINAAAFTAVDLAETHAASARAINATGPCVAAAVAHKLSVPFVHLSTDYVFDGTKTSPYLEVDPTNPINVYGLTKREGEVAILAANPDAVILRTSWVYSPFGKNFLRTMLTLAQTRDSFTIVDDQIGAPTSAKEIAVACTQIVTAKVNGHTASGIFHMTGDGQATWFAFAEEIFSQTAKWRRGNTPRMLPVSTANYPTPAQRPLNSRLNCDLLEAQFGIRLPHWTTSLREALGALENEFGAVQWET